MEEARYRERRVFVVVGIRMDLSLFSLHGEWFNRLRSGLIAVQRNRELTIVFDTPAPCGQHAKSNQCTGIVILQANVSIDGRVTAFDDDAAGGVLYFLDLIRKPE